MSTTAEANLATTADTTNYTSRQPSYTDSMTLSHSSRQNSYTDSMALGSTQHAAGTFSITDSIWANDLTSRANYCYACCAAMGFASALFIFYSFIKSYRDKINWTWADTILSTYSISEFCVLLNSLFLVVHIPGYLKTTNLSCAILSFFFNVAYLNGQLSQVLMVFFLAFHMDPPIDARLQKVLDNVPVCVAATALVSLLASMLLTGLLDTDTELYSMVACQLDPFQAHRGYETVKLIIGFIIPTSIILECMVVGCLVSKRSNGSFLFRLKAYPVFLVVTLVTFTFRLIYNSVLMKTASLKSAHRLTPSQEAIMSVGEFVLFSGSCISLVMVLFLHEPCRKSLWEAARNLRGYCRSMGRREPNNYIMTPCVEFSQEDQTEEDNNC